METIRLTISKSAIEELSAGEELHHVKGNFRIELVPSWSPTEVVLREEIRRLMEEVRRLEEHRPGSIINCPTCNSKK